MKTKKKKAKGKETKLELKKEELTQAVLESIPDPVVITDFQGRVVQFNSALTRNYGYGEETIGKLVFDIFLTKEDLARATEALMLVIREGYMKNFECSGITKDKKLVPVLISLALQKSAKGVPTGIVAVLKEITELKRVQKELEEAKVKLEEKVQERTKELQEKMEELEKFQKFATGRELRMMQLKEEIEKLKEELAKYKGRY